MRRVKRLLDDLSTITATSHRNFGLQSTTNAQSDTVQTSQIQVTLQTES